MMCAVQFLFHTVRRKTRREDVWGNGQSVYKEASERLAYLAGRTKPREDAVAFCKYPGVNTAGRGTHKLMDNAGT